MSSSENGIATADDSRRIDYTEGALEGLHDAISDGVTVLGYLHWSAAGQTNGVRTGPLSERNAIVAAKV